MVRDALKNYLALAGGMTEVTRQRALAAARSLASSGEATAEQVSGIAEELLAASRGNREAAAALVKLELDRALGRLGFASAEEVAALSARVELLEAQLRARPAGTGPAKAAKSPGRAASTPAGGKVAPGKAAPAKAAKKAPRSGPTGP